MMADRSITARLRLEIGDLKSKAKEAGAALRKSGDEAKAASEGAAKASLSAADAEKIRADVRTQAAAADVRANEQLKMQQEQYGKLTASILANRQEIDQLAGAALAGGALLSAGFGLAVKTFADFDEQMSAVAATGQDARVNIDGLRETAQRLGKDTQYSAGEAAQGIEELLKAGVSAADVMGGGLAGALDLAAAGQISVADAAETAATAMVQFKLEGSAVPHIADLLAAAAGKAQGGVADMAGALSQSGLVASQFGLSIEETTGVLAAFASSGLIGSDAGTSFKSMLLKLASPAGKTATLMRNLGINAYDASGAFIGMVPLAGQLQNSLKDLTQAERDAALGRIFGTDAIRAANVLYQQGADGIADWIDQVDESGFAAETAATKTDNLAGDIERLGGAIDDALIQSGSGANSALRGMAQGLEHMVERAAALPEPLLNAAAGVAGLSGAGLLAFGSFAKLTTGFVDTRIALRVMREEMPRLATGLSKVGKAAGIAMAGVGAFILIGEVQKRVSDFTVSVTEAQVALEKLAKSGDIADIDKMFNIQGGMGDVDIRDLAEAIELLKDASGGGFTADMNNFFSGLAGAVGITDELGAARDRFKELDEVMSEMDPTVAAAAFKQISEAMYEQGLWGKDVVEMFPKMAEAARELAKSANFDLDSNGGVHTLVKIMQGEMPEAMRKSLEATEEGRKALEEYGVEAGKSTMTLAELVEMQRDAASAALSLSGAQIGYEEALVAATKSIKDNGRNLDITTEKGRNNRKALDGLAKSAMDVVEAMENNNESAKKVSKTQDRLADDFLKTARQMGFNAREAAELALEYGFIPKKVTTDMLAKGSKASKKEIDKFNRDLNKIPREKRANILSVFLDKGVKAAQREINKVKSKTVTLNIQPHYRTPTGKPPASGKAVFFSYADGGSVQRLADGGFSSPGNQSLSVTGGRVRGSSPDPRADNIPTMLTAREFVQPVSAVDKYGHAFMEAVRSGRFPRDLAAVGLADGGRPDGRQRARSSEVRVVQSGGSAEQRPIQQQIIATQVNPHALLMAAGQRLGGL